MNTCMCGNPIDTIGTTCSRCGALQTLGLDMNASAAEIEATYMTLVKVWHPDRFQTDLTMKNSAEAKLKEINAAHDYLTGAPSFSMAPSGAAHKVEFAPMANPTGNSLGDRGERAATVSSPVESSDDEEQEEVRRIMKRLQKRSPPKTLIKLMVTLGVIGAVGLLGFSLDFLLSANESTARPWDQFKAEVAQDLRAKGILPSATEAQGSKDENAQQASQPVAPAVASAGTPAVKSENPSAGHSTNAAKAMNVAKPYVTSGLTPMEVLAILGKPTSSTGEKMFYKESEIDFRNGQVAGWKIDQKTAPIRVKLWPDAAPVPGVTTFAVGSSKSDVIAVQGTPTLFSDSQFGYGGSIVFFQNERVSGWKEDPSSVRLRVVAH